jgi:hypothetical protein
MDKESKVRIVGWSPRVRERFPEGTRVRFTADAERYPHFVVPAGSTARITDLSDHCILAKVEQFVPGLSDNDDWEGEFQYSMDDALSGEDCPFEPFEPAATNAPGDRVLVSGLAHARWPRSGCLTVDTLRKALAGLPGDKPVEVAIFDGPTVAYSSELNAAWDYGPGDVVLVGTINAYDPEDHVCLKCGGVKCDQGALGAVCVPCSDAELDALNSEGAA